MSILKTKPEGTDPATLSDRLVTARDAFNAEKAAVIDLATQRTQAISEIVSDLNEESAALNSIVLNAQKS